MNFVKVLIRQVQLNGGGRGFRYLQLKTSCLLIVIIAAPIIASAQISPRGSSDKEAAAELRRAAELMQSGKIDEAEPILRRVIVSNPNNADAHNLLGVVFDQKGRTQAAEREFRTSISLNPKGVSAMANLGVLLAHAKRDDEAIKTFEAVLRAAEEPDALQHLGHARPQLAPREAVEPPEEAEAEKD